MINKYLLAFHIGPVQDFIATARRTQDLWMGSWLLSHLSRTAALSDGLELILPQHIEKTDDPTRADMPNHFLARFESDDKNKADLAGKIEAAVQDEWVRIANVVKGQFFGTVPPETWNRQVNGCLEIYWAVVSGNDEAARNKAQTALDARKRLRNFEYALESHLKCTLCGLRQEISGKNTHEDARKWWETQVKKHRPNVRIREDGSERLCAVCAIKRTALSAGAFTLDKHDGHFPSTSSMATATFKQQLLKAENTADIEKKLQAHFTALERAFLPAEVDEHVLAALLNIEPRFPQNQRRKLLTHDGDLFYPEIFNPDRFKKEYPIAWEKLSEIWEQIQKYAEHEATCLEFTLEEYLQLEPLPDSSPASKLAVAQSTLRDLYRTLGERPSKYFAVLMMDGDHMGAFFSKADQNQAAELSRCVSDFARTKAAKIVEDHFGRMVYAGGDDTLALLPLKTMLPCARKLQEAFKKAVAEAIEEVGLPQACKAPTPSAGIVVAHYLAPLDGVLQAARHAENAAKNTYGRDAVCVYVLKRSGEEVRIGTHWTHGGQSCLEAVEKTVELLSDDVLSMKFTYAVAGEARGLAELECKAHQSELKRLAKRHKGEREKFEAHEAEVLQLVEELACWSHMPLGPPGNEKPLGLAEIAQWILLARFIASGGRDEE